MESIRYRLSKADTDLLHAFTEGPAALDSFDRQFSNLQQDIERLLQSGDVDEDLMELAAVTASRVALYAQALYDISAEARALESDMVGEIESIFMDLTISDKSVHSSRIPPFPRSTHSLVDASLFDRPRESTKGTSVVIIYLFELSAEFLG